MLIQYPKFLSDPELSIIMSTNLKIKESGRSKKKKQKKQTTQAQYMFLYSNSFCLYEIKQERERKNIL